MICHNRQGGSCFGDTIRNLSLHLDHCGDGQITTFHIYGYKQPCESGELFWVRELIEG